MLRARLSVNSLRTASSANACAAIDPAALAAAQAMFAAMQKELVSAPQVSLGRFSVDEICGLASFPCDAGMEEVLAAILEFLDASSIRRTVPECKKVLMAIGTPPAVDEEIRLAQLKLSFSADEWHRTALQLRSLFRRLERSHIWSSSVPDSIEALIAGLGIRFLQFDLGRLPFRERAVFASAALKVLWERQERQETGRATFVVLDEAHHLAPEAPKSTWQEETAEWVNRIAGEGRKYGLYLLLASQRPAKIHANTLDNCQNFFLLRLQNRDDLDRLARSTAQVAASLIDGVASLRRHEALILGDVTAPVVVRIGRRRVGYRGARKPSRY